MNIFHKITRQSLQKNRTRTIVTIIGVILSVAMITAVTTFIASLQNFLVQREIQLKGDWHVEFMDVDSAFAQKVRTDDEVKNAFAIQNVGYALLDGGQNPNKPYLFVAGLDDTAFGKLPIKIAAGRLPGNSGEIIVPEHIETNGVGYKIGDTLTLSLGSRMIDGKKAGQNTPFHSGGAENGAAESFLPETVKTYTV
ncbi:MAG: ABC transporter permease, partial [Clostridiales Family XIII bacterium]|nr:ABC transporter permease [Clostridiales Family XIII bacterium]